jgi:hypothetical protein
MARAPGYRAERNKPMIENLTKQQFIDNVASIFIARQPQGPNFELKLTDVVDHGSTPKQEQFSLMFTGPLAVPPRQAIYSLEHPVLGTFDLFLVPVAQNADSFGYEAVINRFP